MKTVNRRTVLLIEPEPGGHRFQAVANVAAVAAQFADVMLLTSHGATSSEEFGVYLADSEMVAVETFDGIHPPTAAIAAAVAEICRSIDVSTMVIMDADRALKRWFYVARREFKGLGSRKPRVVFMLTRYPARLRITDWVSWRLRAPKGLLAGVAIGTGTLDHVAGFAGRDDMAKGWIVKRTRDPEICTANSRDRAALRAELGLPLDRQFVGIFGVIEERKNAPLILDALDAAGLDDVDLVLAGGIDSLPPERRARLVLCDGFLTNELLDKYVAAVDAIPIALTNNGPSGIMGKALAAGVPVVTAGSRVRARELRATDGGVVAELTAESIGMGVREVLQRDPNAPRRNTVPPATADEFARDLLGVDQFGNVRGRVRRKSRNRP
jgi:glycosyltransferase involved in cell wall biosynthesis